MINYEKEHRRLWNWLADHPEMDKEDYFKGWPEECIPDNGCFACEEAQERWWDSKAMKYSWDPDAELAFCEFCPIGDLAVMGCYFPWSGLFGSWKSADLPEEKAKIARKIAELPWKEADDNETDRCR